MKDRFSVTFVVAATNETISLKTTVEQLITLCPQNDMAEILIIHSQTATVGCRETIREIERKHPFLVKGIEQTRPHVGGGMQDGFDMVKSSHFILIPGDLAIDLNCIPEVIKKEKIIPNCIVKTSRWLEPGSFQNYPKFRRLLNACAQKFLQVLFHSYLTDFTNPVQLMPTSLYHKIKWKELKFPFLIEMVLAPLRLGIAFEEIPTNCYGRTEGKSNNSILQTAFYLKTALRIRFTKPEKLLKLKERSA